MNPVLGTAIFIILWWLTFFVLLPWGATSHHEAGDVTEPGVERGAPRAPNLGMKALIAVGIAAVLWLGTAWAIQVDLIGMMRG